MAQHGNKIGNVGPTWLNMGPMRPNIGPTCALQRANIEHVVLFIGTLELTANTPVRAVVVAKPPEYLSFKSGHSGPESKLRQASDANETSRAFQLIPPVKNKMQKGKTVRHFMLIECLISSSATLQLWPLQGLMSCELSLNQSKNSRCQAARYCKTSGCSCWHSRMDLSCLGNGSGKQHNSTMHVMNESRNVKNAKTVYGNSMQFHNSCTPCRCFRNVQNHQNLSAQEHCESKCCIHVPYKSLQLVLHILTIQYPHYSIKTLKTSQILDGHFPSGKHTRRKPQTKHPLLGVWQARNDF